MQHFEEEVEAQDSVLNDQFNLAEPPVATVYTGARVFIIRQFIVTRVLYMDPVKSEDEPEAGQMQRHYAMVTIHSLEKEISEGTLIVNVNLA